MVAAGWGVVVTHGNGPQVGLHPAALGARAAGRADPASSPWRCRSPTRRAGSGTSWAQALLNELAAGASPDRVVCVLTHVVVDRDDPAFAAPTKPIGPFYYRGPGRGSGRSRWLDDDRGRGARLPARRGLARTGPDRGGRPDPHARRRRVCRDRRRRRWGRGRGDGTGPVHGRGGRHRQGPRLGPAGGRAWTSRCSSSRRAWNRSPSTFDSRTSAGSTHRRRRGGEPTSPRASSRRVRWGPRWRRRSDFLRGGGKEVLITTPGVAGARHRRRDRRHGSFQT